MASKAISSTNWHLLTLCCSVYIFPIDLLNYVVYSQCKSICHDSLLSSGLLELSVITVLDGQPLGEMFV